MRIVLEDRRGSRLDEVGEAGVREPPAERPDDRGGEYHVADQPEADQQDVQGSMVASSISMTGMSSLIWYTRWQVSHFSAVPFLTSLTGVLQFGQARISSSSESTGMG